MSWWDAASPSVLVFGAITTLLAFGRTSPNLVRLALCVIAGLLLVRYELWRTFSTMSLPQASLSSLWYWIFYLCELVAGLSGLVALVTLSRSIDRSEEATDKQAWLYAWNPQIDILIATFNEEREILERTIVGAKSQAYQNFRVFVLDDGDRTWLEDLCDELDVLYVTRPEHRHAKSGNMNHAIEYLRRHGGLGELIAVLDADFIAQPDFLNRAAALFHDERVGIVQTPQHFFNSDPLQHTFAAGGILPDEQRFFFDVMLPSRDAWGTAFCCGTSSICRRDALMDVGGFPIESITEDMLLSIKMRSKGWKTVYLNEKLSFGLAPEGLSEYLTQRGRWCIGFMQIFTSAYGPFRRNGLTLVDRFGLVDAFMFWAFSYPFRLACILVPAIYWLTGAAALDAGAQELLYYMVPSVVAQMLVLGYLSRGRILPLLTDASQLLVAIDIIRAVFQGLVFPGDQKFKVTDKGGDRNHITVHWHLLGRFLSMAAIIVAAMFVAYGTGGADFHTSAATVTLIWTYYAFVVLSIAAMTCIELPREREEAFDCCELAEIQCGEVRSEIIVRRISVSSAVVASPLPSATLLKLRLKDVDGDISVHAMGTDGRQSRVLLEATASQRRQIIRKIFTERYVSRPDSLSFVAIYARLLRGFFAAGHGR
jgi:cellulose synthase (UDP-forming)